MDPEFYRAAQSGNWEAIRKFSVDFYNQQTANGNTILHILAQSGDSFADAVKQILSRKFDLVFKKNSQGETPLVIASRRGHPDVVRAFIDCAKGSKDHRTSGAKRLVRMLAGFDQHGNNALHEAVRNNRYDVVKLLVEADPLILCGHNFAGESPLYIVVEKGYHEIVSFVLSTYKSISYLAPGRKTALHAAAARNYPETMKMILEKKPDLTKEVDVLGWTALHYAAKFGHREQVKLLLSTDKSIGYIVTKYDDSKSALHMAVIHGHLDVIQEILLHCPDCWEVVTRKHQNMLHLAVENEQKEVLDFILGSSWASELVNKKDVQGNTPLHLYAVTNNLEGNNLVNYPSVDRDAFDNEGLTPLDIITQKADKLTNRQSSIKEEFIKAGATPGLRIVNMKLDTTSETSKRENVEDYMVVATLIVTVTFAAGFTIPGGYDSTEGNEGMAVLSKKAAFTAFIVSDSLAMFFSVIAVLQHFAFKENIVPPSLKAWFKNFHLPRVNNASYIALAMTLMLIAFLTGLYVVLPVKALKIYLLVVGSVICLPFPGCLLIALLRLIITTLLRLRGMEPEKDMFELIF